MLPKEIQNNKDLYFLQAKLQQQRTDFQIAVSKMDSGVFGIKRIFKTLMANIQQTISTFTESIEAFVIPKDSFDDFENSISTLDDFTSFEMLKYYNGLQQLSLSLKGIEVALLDLTDVEPRPITSKITNTGVFDSLDSDEFTDQGPLNPTTEVKQKYEYYVVMQGDTLTSIANKVYEGNILKSGEIARANKISDNDLLDGSLLGTTILIPAGDDSGVFSASNMVFETKFIGTDQKKLDRYTYGADIFLRKNTSNSLGKIVVDESGDMLTMEGIKGVVANLNDRINSSKDGLNPMVLDYGIDLSSGDVPFPVAVDRIMDQIEAQYTYDSRVETASVLRKTIKQKGDAVYADVEIVLKGNQTVKESIQIPVL